MKLETLYPRWWSALVAAAVLGLAGCEPSASVDGNPSPQASSAAQAEYQPITVKHALGETTIEQLPRRVVAFDMNDVDSLDQLGVPVAGMPKDYVPHFLASYRDDAGVEDLGAIVRPNLERVYALKPDLILISPVQAQYYDELSEIAPTLHFDWDLLNEQGSYIDIAKDHLLTLGRIFQKQALAREKVAEISAGVERARSVTAGRPETALIVMHNNGAYSSFGIRSRYGFVFDTLGVKPASRNIEPGLHGQPISNEFISAVDPDILYVIDRTAVMERKATLTMATMANPLLQQTRAWKAGRVVFVDAQTWYVTAASVTSLGIIVDEVIQGYRTTPASPGA